jgi:ferrous iron transport protein A
MVNRTASQLNYGEEGVIKNLQENSVSLKLLELGCLPGKSIRMMRKAPAGHSIYFKVGSQNLALRLEEAKQVFLQ